MPLVAPSNVPDSAIAAVAIKRIQQSPREQYHVGLLYRPDAGAPPRMLHLGWHHQLNDAVVGDSYACVLLTGLPKLLAPFVVTTCKLAAAAPENQKMPYGFGYQVNSVRQDPTTGVITLHGPSGLTCATFVLAMLDVAGFVLLDLATWEAREGDERWKDAVLDLLEQHGASPEHVESVRADRSHTRVRPDDVAGGADIGANIDFVTATRAGAVIRAAL